MNANLFPSRRPRSLLIAIVAIGITPTILAGDLDRDTAAAGLKEALQVGAGRAVELLGAVDGYLGNPEVRIPLPNELKRVGKGLRKIGLKEVVDEFETSMNRAAEAAAPLAKEVFVDTIKQIGFEDALAIVRGNDHSATDYLRENAGPKLTERFHPIVLEQLETVGATSSFGRMMDSVSSLPFLDKPAFELDRYVTDKALDGMFHMIAKEEEKIRKDPLARTSELLETVFGGGDRKKDEPWWKRLFD